MLSITEIVLQEQRNLHLLRTNPFGLKNMSGNVAEFCSDFYSPDTYKADSIGVNQSNRSGEREGTCYPGRFI